MKSGRMRRNWSRGFTIIELLIVIVVIGILATLVIVGYNGIQSQSRVSAAAASATQASKKVASYYILNSEQLPASLAAVGISDTDSVAYQYTINTTTTPQLFCLTATTSGTSSHIASGGTAQDGPCLGHTGTVPTKFPDGSTCPTNYILVPGSSLFGTSEFCVMKYEAKIQGQANGNQTYSSAFVAESRADGTPWVNVSQITALAEATALGSTSHLITEPEWLTIAHNTLAVATNWSGGVVGSGFIYSGNNDGAPGVSIAATTVDSDGYNGTGNTSGSGPNQRRTLTLTNGEVIWDFAGNVSELTQGTLVANQLPGTLVDSIYVGRQYNASDLVLNTLPASALPKYGTAAANGWTTANGIGFIYTNYNETQTFTRGFLRSGSFGGGTGDGVLALYVQTGSGSIAGVTAGFRVSR